MGNHHTSTSIDSWLRTVILFIFLLIYAFFLYKIAKHVEMIGESASKIMDRISEAMEPSIVGSVISALISAAT